jgi:hypothetical protein
VLLNKIDANTLIPNACQNPIGLTELSAGTKHVFHNNCVGRAKIKAAKATRARAPNIVPSFSDVFI